MEALTTGALLLIFAASILDQRPDPPRQTCPKCRHHYNTGAMHDCAA